MIAGIVLGIVASLLANELCELSPWCARKLVRWSAFRQYTDRHRAEMRAEEWTAVINDRPGNLFKLITAVGFTATAVIVSGRRAVGQGADVGPGSKIVLLVRRFMYGWQLADSRIDTKTGLLNASTWEQEAAAEIAHAVKRGSPLALALVDIDHFKLVNDAYGHLAGDKALRAVTDALRSQLRAYDLAGRFGGEEFAILLPHACEVDALHLAERCRAHIAALSIPVGDDAESGPFVKLTISAGVALLDGPSCELTDMLVAADAALYYAKKNGRNKTHVATGAVSGRRAVGQASDVGPGSKTVLLVRQSMHGLRLAQSRIDTKTRRVVRGFMFGWRHALSRPARPARSRIDTKTGLLNASTWEQEAAAEIAHAVKRGSPLALALVDIDHFKLVNDAYGHLAGDKALRAVTDALRSQLRAYDLAGRFGGEEFAILLPHACEVDALHLAERCRAHIAALSIPVGDDAESGPFVKLTISAGVALLDGPSCELTDMLVAADAALYYAKKNGRNKTHVATALPA